MFVGDTEEQADDTPFPLNLKQGSGLLGALLGSVTRKGSPVTCVCDLEGAVCRCCQDGEVGP